MTPTPAITKIVPRILATAWLIAALPLAAVPVNTTLTLVTEQPAFNRLSVKLAPPSPLPSDTDTTDLSGTLPVALDINPVAHTTTVMTLLDGSSVDATDMHFSGSFLFVGYNLNATDVSGQVFTDSPPGVVTPATGQFAANQHQFIIDQGSITGTAALTDVNESFSNTPANGTGTGTGTVILTPTGVTGRFQNYNVTVTFPVSLDQTIDASDNDVTFTASGQIKATGTVKVPLSDADIVWTGAVSGDWKSGGDENFSAASSPTPFLDGDRVTFNDSPSRKSVKLTGPVSPGGVSGGITFNHNQNYTVTATGTGQITGSTGLIKKSTGMLTLGGSANNFTGPVSIQAGTLQLGNREALGNNSGISISSGARLDLNGRKPSDAGRHYTLTITGSGPDGAGAIINSGGSVTEDGGIKNLILSGNASIGGNGGRFDVGLSGTERGTITGNGHTLTKVGSNSVDFRAPANGSLIHFVIAEGIAYAEDSNFAWGGSGGTLTIKNGARGGTYGARTISTPVTIESGGTLHNQGGSTGTWSGPISVTGNVTVDDGSKGINLNGLVSGAANLTKSGTNTTTIAQPAWTGTTTVASGTLRINQANLNYDALVSIAPTAVLDLHFAGSETISHLSIGGIPQPSGVYNSSHATQGARFAGTGSLVVDGPPYATFTFLDNNNPDNPPNSGSPFDTTGAGVTDIKNGLTLTSVAVNAPRYVKTIIDPETWTWDGVSYVASKTNVTGSNAAIGVDNLSTGTGNANPIKSENSSFHPGESWTIKFDHDVVIESFDLSTFDDGDQITVEFGGNVRTFTGGTDVNPLVDPFGGLVIPANASITIANTNEVPTPLPGGVGGTTVPGWRIAGITARATSFPPVPSYGLWAGQNITNELLRGFNADADSDGISNGIEYVLGGDPNVSDTDILPTLDSSGVATVKFVFYRDDTSIPATIQTVEYGDNLSGWTAISVYPGPAPAVTVEDQGGGISKITVTIDKHTPSMFVRLKVIQTLF